MTHRLPTAKEINVFDSLDERWAVKIFLGKDREQAKALFRESFLNYSEALLWMGPVAFRFYVRAAIDYLLSEEAEGDADAVNSFCRLIEHRLEYEPAVIASVANLIRESILGILDGFDRYGGDDYIYGDLAGRYRVLLTKLGA